MTIACVFSPTEPMRVVSFEEREKLIATGLWFRHPNEAKEVRKKHEEQIRRNSEQRLNDHERSTNAIGTRTRGKKSIRKEAASGT